MAYEVKITRQCQTTISKAIRKKYKIFEGDKILYVDPGDHVAIIPVSKYPVKDLEGLEIDIEQSVSEMRKEALERAKKVADKKQADGDSV